MMNRKAYKNTLCWLLRLSKFSGTFPQLRVSEHEDGASPNQLLLMGAGQIPFSPAPLYLL